MLTRELQEIVPGLASRQDLYARLRNPIASGQQAASNGSSMITNKSVSSNCALLLPSTVVAVQLSGQCTISHCVPRLTICIRARVNDLAFGNTCFPRTGSIVRHWRHTPVQSIGGRRASVPQTHHTGLHHSHGLVLRIMRHVRRRGVEEVVDPMTGILSYDRAVGGTRDGFAGTLLRQ
jgi:hypothetical protein